MEFEDAGVRDAGSDGAGSETGNIELVDSEKVEDDAPLHLGAAAVQLRWLTMKAARRQVLAGASTQMRGN